MALQCGALGAPERLAHPSRVQLHLELLQVQPLLGLVGIQVVVKVPGGIPETVELPLWSQQDGGRSLLVGHPRVASLPSPAAKERQRLWAFLHDVSTYCVHGWYRWWVLTVAATGTGYGIVLSFGGSFLGLIVFFIYLGGMMVVFGYTMAMATEQYHFSWLSGDQRHNLS